MIDEEKTLILDGKKKDITKNVIRISDSKVHVHYNNDKIYSYKKSSLLIIKNPILLENCLIKTSSRTLSNVMKILKFNDYIKIFFNNGTTKIYHQSEITIEKNLLKQSEFKDFFDYLSELASYLTINDITTGETTEEKNKGFLCKIYKKIKFISQDSVIEDYIKGVKTNKLNVFKNEEIYPFSFNLSQKLAVENVFATNISVIEGPPGTGKTQTILNIIANAIINKKSVAVLSNNNSATDNVFEKLEKYGLSSICAKLGNDANVKKFLKGQEKIDLYPTTWMIDESEEQQFRKDLCNMNQDIQWYLEEKNEIAKLRQEMDDLKLEQKHFEESNKFRNENNIILPNWASIKLHEYLLDLNKAENKKEYFSKFIQIKTQLKYRFYNPKLYKHTIKDILDYIELEYYKRRIEELNKKIIDKEEVINNRNLEQQFINYTEKSMKIFKNFVYRNYNNKKVHRNVRDTHRLIYDYPVILSTTYSLLNCVSPNFMFDYVIIDESSQVDLVSAFPALTLAKNVVVVGDSKQLPSIIENEKREQFDMIFKKYNLCEKYNYTKNSLLELTKKIYDDVSIVMLKEHYRCHPKIIGFCNKKFYDNQLIILSKNTNDEPIKQYKCVKGNHARKNGTSQYNDRQGQVIIDEVIPQQKIDIYSDSVGIITPYKAQKNYLRKKIQCDNLLIDTVHGFQGREKDIIIFSTVSNNITKFLDNPNSINVAVSRAINKLYLITPYEYKSKNNSNITNLISYIRYNNMEVIQSKINSVFDMLYKCNEKEKNKFLFNRLPFSRHDSETIMYYTIKKVLQLDEYKSYEVMDISYPLRKIVKDRSILTPEEIKFVDCNSHIDFMIYDKYDKTPVLAIEVDGYKFHNRKEQIIRDQKKNSILKKCNIPLLRFATNECKEEERLIDKLNEIISRENKLGEL